MSSNFKFYRYEGYSYRLEEDSEGKLIAAFILQLDGSWVPLTWGWQAIIENNSPITEEQAFLLAGIKNLNHTTADVSIPSGSALDVSQPDIPVPNISKSDVLESKDSPVE